MKLTKQLIAAALFVMVVAPVYADTGMETSEWNCVWAHHKMTIFSTPDEKPDEFGEFGMLGSAKLIDEKGRVFHGKYTATATSMTVHQDNGIEWFVKPFKNTQWFHSLRIRRNGRWRTIECS